MDDLYNKYKLRADNYRAITDYILENLRKNQHVCVVIYGHPTVFAQPGLDAVIAAKSEGYDAKILPGISAEDCLFADLLINPGSCGCQSFEATDFLIYQRKFDSSSHLILWQIGIIGSLEYPKSHDKAKGLKLLMNYLIKEYPIHHEIIIYEASQYPHFHPRIIKIKLGELAEAHFSEISSLYIPPIIKKESNKAILAELGII